MDAQTLSRLSSLPVCDAAYSVITDRSLLDQQAPFKTLRAAFPQVAALELQAAIDAAFKFDKDCFLYFHYTDDYQQDVERAVTLALADNPVFSQESYRIAWSTVAIAMR